MDKTVEYQCPNCGWKLFLPKGKYYCTKCLDKRFNNKHIDKPLMVEV